MKARPSNKCENYIRVWDLWDVLAHSTSLWQVWKLYQGVGSVRGTDTLHYPLTSVKTTLRCGICERYWHIALSSNKCENYIRVWDLWEVLSWKHLSSIKCENYITEWDLWEVLTHIHEAEYPLINVKTTSGCRIFGRYWHTVMMAVIF